MDIDHILKMAGLDRYDRNARLYPAFLCLLPIIVVTSLWLPQIWTPFSAFSSLAVAGCATFFFAQTVRYLGRQIEKRLGRRVGREHSAVLLSHNDTCIPSETKARYHRYLIAHGVKIPDKERELMDPIASHQEFRSAIDWLLEHTRTSAKSSMLYSENISYGFRRNMLGIKPVSIAFASLAIAVNTYFIIYGKDTSHITSAAVTDIFLSLDLVLWVCLICPSFVQDSSLSYAQRLFAQCESIKKARAPKNQGG